MTNGPEKMDFHIRSVLDDEPENDLILLGTEAFRSEKPGDPFVFLNVTLDELEEGQDIFVISSPLGLPGTISAGLFLELLL